MLNLPEPSGKAAAASIGRCDRQENQGGRAVGATLRHSDRAAMARAPGAHGERAESPDDLQGALRRALDNAPSVVDVVTARGAASSDPRKGLGFVPDFQALTARDEAERRRRGALIPEISVRRQRKRR